MTREIALAEVEGLVGTEIGVSDWILVNQTMIDTFATATDDHQFIHVDPERAAAESPFGGTIAHGFLTLSLLSTMNYKALPKIREQTMGINYGFEKVRFMSPVKCGARIRGRFKLSSARFRGAGMLMTAYEVSIEIEGERKPALTAVWETIVQFDPKDRPVHD
ncbi:MaoC family dehydratase [Rhizobiaceae bacterium n13]|uniref:MaoC family dehydratase n=1 Tax=Ferirhizobium litorale TaxID=2927786 RepID=A0AAE3Q7E2_9HYPH|nr:MaoC family dehydratase [Fererhizobium litorale]MDI7860482.1 MaoC family dehydratase [Fererhizobium litorale]MDI7920617.1 MaoC family dehydratase [Fererhizobium litorale]